MLAAVCGPKAGMKFPEENSCAAHWGSRVKMNIPPSPATVLIMLQSTTR
jgi:hypothetical protein